MVRLFGIIIGFAMVLAFSPVSYAQDSTGFTPALEMLNRVNPKQNDQFTRATRIVGNDIRDNKSRTVGEVQDIVIDKEGNIVSIRSDLDRLNFGGPDLSLDYAELDMRPVSGGYALPMDDSNIQDIYPQLLASIATAAGDSSSLLSMDNLIGADIESADGRRIGRVEDVLFDRTGSRAEALMVRVNYRAVRGKSVAVPLNMPQYVPTGGRPEVVISAAQADALLNLAD